MTDIATSCACCGSTDGEVYPALLSRAAAARLGEKPRATRFVECRRCGFRFFEERIGKPIAIELAYADDVVELRGVLDRSAEPGRVLDEVRRRLGAAASLRIEVHFERPTLRRTHAGWLALVRRSTALQGLVGRYTAAARRRLDHEPPLGMLELGDRLNFFDPPSLRALLEKHGFETVRMGLERIDSDSPVLSATARVA